MSDCIKRDDAMKIICGNCMSPCALVEKANNPCATIKELVYLPSADVAPVRHGRWIDKCDGAECSICGSFWEYAGVLDKNGIARIFRYCETCGARMDGGNDETD